MKLYRVITINIYINFHYVIQYKGNKDPFQAGR